MPQVSPLPPAPPASRAPAPGGQSGRDQGPASPAAGGTQQGRHLPAPRGSPAAPGGVRRSGDVSRAGVGHRKDLLPKACPSPAVPLPLYIHPSPKLAPVSPSSEPGGDEQKAQAGLDRGGPRAHGLKKLPQPLQLLRLCHFSQLLPLATSKGIAIATLRTLLMETGCLGGQATRSPWPPPPPRSPLPSSLPMAAAIGQETGKRGPWVGDVLHRFPSPGCKHGSQAWFPISSPCSPPPGDCSWGPQSSTGRGCLSPSRWLLLPPCLQLLCHSLGARWHFACLAVVSGVLWAQPGTGVPRPQLRWHVQAGGRRG